MFELIPAERRNTMGRSSAEGIKKEIMKSQEEENIAAGFWPAFLRWVLVILTLATFAAFLIHSAAASIIAKVTRDRLMVKYHKKYPVYGFDRHKGYGTRAHIAAIKRHGPSAIHRLSFEPVKRNQKEGN